MTGSAGPRGGQVALYRGNADAIYPHTPEARRRKAQGTFTEAPFLPPPRGFAVPEAPAFLAAGDFDADGHLDLVTAARGSPALYWLRGDGQGGLGPAQRVKLPGRVTALASGEINRADGLADLVVGITGREGPQVLVFEGPEGALRHEPEVLALPVPATAPALGRLDEDAWGDLAVAAGADLVLVSGRDRRLSLDEALRGEVPPATIDSLALAAPIRALAVGSFTGDPGPQLAALGADGTVWVLRHRAAAGSLPAWTGELLTAGPWAGAPQLVRARLSTGPQDDLVIVDPANRQLHLLPGLSGATAFPVTLDVDGAPVAVLPMRLNRDALSDLVVLRQGSAAPTVVLTESPATFTVNSTGDDPDDWPGDGMCGYFDEFDRQICTLRAAIEEANALPGADTIDFDIPGTTLRSIRPFSPLPAITEAVTIDGTTEEAGQVQLYGFYAGTGVDGLTITGGNSVVRGLRVVYFKGDGIRLETNGGNVVEGNWIGTTGSLAAAGNAVGVFVTGAPNNTVGGTAAAARNVIALNTAYGVAIYQPGATGNLVQGNFIGVNQTGLAARANGRGVVIDFNAPGNTIGGTTGTTSGGPCTGACNVISANTVEGVLLSSGTGNLLQGNFIGVDVTGSAKLGNGSDGVRISTPAANNTIGSTTRAGKNVISGNGQNGVLIDGASGNLVQGNFIGPASSGGTVALGNSRSGVFILGAPGNTIGGTTGLTPPGCTGACNFIFNNSWEGVRIQGVPAKGNQIQGNTIQGNSMTGVLVTEDASNNRIGQLSGPNIIAYNGGDGVFVNAGTSNAILHNSIFSNGGLGIDLAPDGVTANDPGDPDTGPNNLQNYPVLTSAYTIPGGFLIRGSLNSTPSRTFTVQFYTNVACNPSGFGDGRYDVGAATVTTGASGNASINVSFARTLSLGWFLTATATDASNNTSEFSRCVQLIAAPDLVVTSLSNPPASVAPGGTFSVTDTTRNRGTATAGASTTRYRLSPDRTITSADLLVGSRSVPSLAAGASSTGSVTVTVPPTIAPGAYYLGACADDPRVVTESYEGNNCRASTTGMKILVMWRGEGSQEQR